ncbi:MAG: acyl-CoA thioesterase [Angustibacter sp.]
MRWSDMDAYGHVNNVQYLRFFEDARIEAFTGRDKLSEGPGMLEMGILVVRHEIEYLKPLKWRPEPVHIDLWLTKVGGAQIDVGYEVYDQPTAAPRIRYAVAESTMAIYDLAQERPRRLTVAERERFTALLGEPVPFKRRRS